MKQNLSLFTAAVLCSGWLHAQSDTLTLSAGASGAGFISVDLSLSSPSGSEPAAIQWAVNFPASQVLAVTVAAGPAATAASKSVTCTTNFGEYDCVVSGGDASQIFNGVVATVTLTLASGVTNTSTGLIGTIAVDPNGTFVTLTGSGGTGGGGGGGGGGGSPVSALSCAPTTITLSGSTTCTVTLATAAPTGGELVSLYSSSDSISLPSTVTIAGGGSSATFTASGVSGGVNGNVTITASAGGTSASAFITISSLLSLTSISCAPSTVVGGDASSCTVNLSGPAPSGGTLVTLSSSNSAVSVPASVTVPNGMSSAPVTVTSSSVTSSKTAVITASYSGVSQTSSLTVVPSVPLTSLSCTLPSVSGTQTMGSNSTASCSVTIASSSTAPEFFALTSTASVLNPPASVSVPAGFTSATFAVNSGSLTSLLHSATLTASGYGSSQSLTLNVAVLVSNLTCSPNAISLPASPSATCTATLTQSVASSTAVTLASSDSVRLSVPSSATISSGSSATTFTASVHTDHFASITLSANVNGIPQNFVEAVGIPPVNTLSCTPNKLIAGQNSACTFTLAAPAPAGGITAYVSTTSTKLAVPANVAVSGGATSGSFTAQALTGYLGPVAVTVKTNAIVVTTSISSAVIGPRPGRGSNQPITSLPQRLLCSPRQVLAGAAIDCELQLTGSGAGESAAVTISAGDAAVRVPSRVATRPNQSSLSFKAAVDPQSQPGTVIIRAVSGDTTIDECLTVVAAVGPGLAVPGKQYVIAGSRTSFSVAAYSSSAPSPIVSAMSLPAGADFNSTTGNFEWTPTLSQTGSWNVIFTVRDSSGRIATGDVPIQVGSGAPSIDKLRNAASGSTESVCSPGSLATLEGGWLASAAVSDPSGQSLELAGTSVQVNGASVVLLSASPNRLVFACPRISPGATMDIAVKTAAGISTAVETPMTQAALGVFTVDGSGNGPSVAMLDESEIAVPRNYLYPGYPAQAGDQVRILMTGLSAQPSSLTVFIGDVPIPGEKIAEVSGSYGINGIQITIPQAVPAGDTVPLRVEQLFADGHIAKSQTATISIEGARQ